MLTCENCGKNVEKLIEADNAYRSAVNSAMIEVYCPEYDYLCVSCVKTKLGISDEDLIRENRL